jgi:hypothetical protein
MNMDKKILKLIVISLAVVQAVLLEPGWGILTVVAVDFALKD